MIRLSRCAALAVALLPTPALACPGFEVHDAYARSSGAMAQTGAAFMVIHNHADQACHITGVRADIAQRTELHAHVQDAQGVMRMTELTDGILLPAQGEHVMARGGDHVMFLGLTAPLEQGATIPVTFLFQDGTERTVEVLVDNERPARAPDHAPGTGHGHSHGN